jgi:dTDP-4-amino-4,6-dideoxygalactose transaminase
MTFQSVPATPSDTKARKIPLLDLQAQFQPIRDEVLQAMTRVADAQQFILGEDVEILEQQLAAHCGANYAVGCGSGSDALLLALMAYDIGPGDEVLTVPYTFFATAGSIHHVGAKPVFVDVNPETFNIDVIQAADAIAANPKIRAVIPVHLFGGCADLDPLCEAARARGIPVIEDAAQSIGSEYKGRRAGSIGELGCFSFFPSKNLGAFGEGGLVTTNDASLAERIKALRVHGRTGQYFHEWVGVNSRLDALQAAILQVKLRYLDGWSEGRQRNANLYRKLITGQNIPVSPPQIAAYQTRHVYNQFVIRCSRRDALRNFLKENGVGTEVYYPLPLHQQPCFASLGYKAGDFPVSEELSRSTLALPIYSELQMRDIEYIAGLMRSFYA